MEAKYDDQDQFDDHDQYSDQYENVSVLSTQRSAQEELSTQRSAQEETAKSIQDVATAIAQKVAATIEIATTSSRSTKAVELLKNWLSTHNYQPYKNLDKDDFDNFTSELRNAARNHADLPYFNLLLR